MSILTEALSAYTVDRLGSFSDSGHFREIAITEDITKCGHRGISGDGKLSSSGKFWTRASLLLRGVLVWGWPDVA